jgi:hypothetical protein
MPNVENLLACAGHIQITAPLIHMQDTTRHILVHVLKLLIFMPRLMTDTLQQNYNPNCYYLTVQPNELHLEQSQHIFIVPEDPGTIFTGTSALTRDTVV